MPKSQVLRLSITPVGEQRTKKQIQKDIADALKEALNETNQGAEKDVKATLKPEGAFVGIAVATIWALKAFGAGALGAAGKISVETLWGRLNKSLRARSLEPGAAPGGKAKKKGKKR